MFSALSTLSPGLFALAALVGAVAAGAVGRIILKKACGAALVGCFGAAAFALLLALFGFSVSWVVHCALSCVLLALSLIDLKSLTIPNKFIAAIVGIWAAYVVFLFAEKGEGAALPYFSDGVFGALVVGFGMLAVSVVFEKATGRSALGGGDVKLFFAVSLFLGLAPAILNVLVSCIVGLLLALMPRMLREGDQAKVFPFGPGIGIATLLTLVWGDPLVVWYITAV